MQAGHLPVLSSTICLLESDVSGSYLYHGLLNVHHLRERNKMALQICGEFGTHLNDHTSDQSSFTPLMSLLQIACHFKQTWKGFSIQIRRILWHYWSYILWLAFIIMFDAFIQCVLIYFLLSSLIYKILVPIVIT